MTPDRRPPHGLLAEVAAAAGVSRATVSKVVHRRSDVASATRSRVEHLLDARGYVRPWDPPAKTPQFFVVFRDLSSPYTLEVARGVVQAAEAMNASATVGTTESRSVSGWLDLCASMDAAGVIFVISLLTERDQARIVEQHVPVVLIDPLSEPTAAIPSVGVTNWGGAHAAVQHLVELGHRRIGMLAGRPSSLAGRTRLHGYRAALDEAGLAYDETIVKGTDFDFGEAVAASTTILRHPDPPTAIFASSDAQALGVIEGARRCEVSVPDQLSIISFDGTLASATASPPLTAICQPFGQMGREATRLLLQVAAGEVPQVHRLELATHLVERKSTASLDPAHPAATPAAEPPREHAAPLAAQS